MCVGLHQHWTATVMCTAGWWSSLAPHCPGRHACRQALQLPLLVCCLTAPRAFAPLLLRAGGRAAAPAEPPRVLHPAGRPGRHGTVSPALVLRVHARLNAGLSLSAASSLQHYSTHVPAVPTQPTLICLLPSARCLLFPLCSWLRPYSNGALPLLQIRSTLVDLLALMNLDTGNLYTREKLEQSELGKIVMFYEKNPHDKSSECVTRGVRAAAEGACKGRFHPGLCGSSARSGRGEPAVTCSGCGHGRVGRAAACKVVACVRVHGSHGLCAACAPVLVCPQWPSRPSAAT